MPCYYTGSAEGDARLAADEANKALTEMADLLCHTCKYADKNSLKLPPKTQIWWGKHKKLDAARKK